MFITEPVRKATQMFLQCLTFFYMNAKTARTECTCITHN